MLGAWAVDFKALVLGDLGWSTFCRLGWFLSHSLLSVMDIAYFDAQSRLSSRTFQRCADKSLDSQWGKVRRGARQGGSRFWTCSSIFGMSSGSVMAAMMRNRPPHSGHSEESQAGPSEGARVHQILEI